MNEQANSLIDELKMFAGGNPDAGPMFHLGVREARIILEHIAWLKMRIPKWISVDTTPSDGPRRLIVLTEQGIMGEASYSCSAWLWANGQHILGRVTHWMPLSAIGLPGDDPVESPCADKPSTPAQKVYCSDCRYCERRYQGKGTCETWAGDFCHSPNRDRNTGYYGSYCQMECKDQNDNNDCEWFEKKEGGK